MIDGPWDVTFPPQLGAPEKIQLAKLESWTANADAGVKYFSGTASYSTALNASEDWFAKGTHVLLDLGKVNDLATVWSTAANLARFGSRRIESI